MDKKALLDEYHRLQRKKYQLEQHHDENIRNNDWTHREALIENCLVCKQSWESNEKIMEDTLVELQKARAVIDFDDFAALIDEIFRNEGVRDIDSKHRKLGVSMQHTWTRNNVQALLNAVNNNTVDILLNSRQSTISRQRFNFTHDGAVEAAIFIYGNLP